MILNKDCMVGVFHKVTHHTIFKRAHEGSHVMYLVAALADIRLLHSTSIIVLIAFTFVDLLCVEEDHK